MEDYKVQTILFDKDVFTLKEAKDWLEEHHYKNEVDEKENTYRFRQVSPTTLKKKGYTKYITKPLGKKSGIKIVIAYQSKEGGKLSASEIKNFLNESYNKKAKEHLDGYELDKSLSHDTAKVYHDPKTGKTVVAHRGTSGIKDWANNLAYAVGAYKYTDRYKKGKKSQEEAEKKYGKENISTLGHSQGAVNARLLGKDTKEIINVNPAYRFEKPAKNEYTVRSSSDVVSAPYAPIAKAREYLFPKYSEKRDITIKSKNPTNVLGEHSYEILDRLGDQQIGTGSGRRVRGRKAEDINWRIYEP